MLNPDRKFTGTDYTSTAAFIVAALVFSPAALFASGVSYASMSFWFVFSVVCLGFAWFKWTRSSRLTIATIQSRLRRL